MKEMLSFIKECNRLSLYLGLPIPYEDQLNVANN